MRYGIRWTAAFLMVSGLLLSSCQTVEEEVTRDSPATIEPIEGTDLVRVILTEKAVERLDMQTATVRNAGKAGKAGESKLVIPYASVFYGPTGDTWTYINPEPLTFERAPIEIDRIDGNRVFLSDGPPPGTAVVRQGAAELFGIETGVDES
jgi:multidrug efflux pump subunit AcrA (membrane-fusion protein)